ncbi:hypothetical protein [Nocardioides panzhihuensis]|uniref:Uncharacterized protein n=1 Tax=Nocardioides panzhihuensis TaxID=860243 RepID=A0A7Z0DHJ3_9ACTN|nr:hypothetical protein [Nocardioides panzhihuensis]NYI75704.1 hypothetical protein [Nocardioides panzhihuensis]
MPIKPGRRRRIAIVSGLALLLAATTWFLWPGPSPVSTIGSDSLPTVPPPASVTMSETPSASPSPTTPSASPNSSARPTTPAPSDTPERTKSTTRAAPPAKGFPTRESAGLPAGWKPKRTVTGDFWIRHRGAVVEDLRITNGVIYVTAPGVTLRRIQAVASSVVNDYNDQCSSGLLIEDSDFVRSSAPTTEEAWPAVSSGGYTVRNVVIDGVPEGLRASNKERCGGIRIEDSFIRVTSPDVCNDWHGDGLQGYGGGKVKVRRTVMILEVKNECHGTAPFFNPEGQGNDSVDIDGLVVAGGGYPFRNGMPGPTRNLYVVDQSWVFGPLDVDCSVATDWSAAVVTMDSAGQPVPIRDLPCE